MKTLWGIPLAVAATLVSLGSEAAFAGQPGIYVQLNAPRQGVYLQAGTPYSRPWIRQSAYEPYGRTVIYPSHGQGYYRDRAETIIVAPTAETIIINQGRQSGDRTRIITRDGYRDYPYRDWDGYRPRTIGGRLSPAPYPYDNSRSYTCYPTSWRNSAFNGISRRSCN
ncbi:hypothetical protein [Trichothermofontia sp.]